MPNDVIYAISSRDNPGVLLRLTEMMCLLYDLEFSRPFAWTEISVIFHSWKSASKFLVRSDRTRDL